MLVLMFTILEEPMYRREVYSNLGHYGKLIAADKSKACIQRDAVKTRWSIFS